MTVCSRKWSVEVQTILYRCKCGYMVEFHTSTAHTVGDYEVIDYDNAPPEVLVDLCSSFAESQCAGCKRVYRPRLVYHKVGVEMRDGVGEGYLLTSMKWLIAATGVLWVLRWLA